MTTFSDPRGRHWADRRSYYCWQDRLMAPKDCGDGEKVSRSSDLINMNAEAVVSLLTLSCLSEYSWIIMQQTGWVQRNPVTLYSEILLVGVFVWSCVWTCPALPNLYLRAGTKHSSRQATYRVSTARSRLKYSLMLAIVCAAVTVTRSRVQEGQTHGSLALLRLLFMMAVKGAVLNM